MQNNIKKNVKKANRTYLSSGIDALIILMGIIYTPNILNQWFTVSLYDTPTFQKLICDRFHFLQEFLHFSGKANSSYDPNDGRRGCCHQVCLFTDMKLFRKLYILKSN